MRIRSTKPEFWRSKTIAGVDWDARLVLKGLESYVDDNGVGKDDTALMVGDVFPRDMLANPRETVARVTEAVSRLHQAGLIWRYEADGVDLLYISNWDTLQRVDKPNKGRLPRPDGTMDYKESIIRESVANPRESVAPVTGEQGNRGTGEQSSLAQTFGPSEFDTFWSVFPRKVGKQKARGKYAAAVKRAGDEQTVIDGARRFASDPNLPEQQFIPHPTTWLERDGWDDEPLPSQSAPQSSPARSWLDVAREADQQFDYIDGQVIEFRELG